MKEIFFKLLLFNFFSLIIINQLSISSDIYFSLSLCAFLFSLILFSIKRYKLSVFLIVLSIIFLISNRFELKKEYYSYRSNLLKKEIELSVEGRLLNFTEYNENSTTFMLKIDKVNNKKHKNLINTNIRVKVKGLVKNIFKGDRIKVFLKIYPRGFIENFEKSGFRNYMLYKGINYYSYCKSKKLVEKRESTNPFYRIIGEWRERIESILFKNRNKEIKKENIMIEALLLGNRKKLDNFTKDRLISIGIFHLIAISGLHIGIIAFLIFYILKLFKLNRRVILISTGVFLLLFSFFSGTKISALRAVIMAEFIIVSKLLSKRTRILNVIGLSGFFIIASNPFEILDIGFVLTYSLTIGIIKLREVFLELIKTRYLFVNEFLAANLSASLVSIPLSIYFFKRYSLISIISNLILLPIMVVITGLSVLIMIFSPFSDIITEFIIAINSKVLSLFYLIIKLIDNTINIQVFKNSPNIIYIILYFIILFYLKRIISIKGFKLIAVILIAILIIYFLFNPFTYKPKTAEFYFIDVGQGDSELIVFPSGKSLLIDGGGSYYSDFEIGKNYLLPFILEKNIKIEWVAISHYHPDHIRGVLEILDIVNPREIWLSSIAYNNYYYKKLNKRYSYKIKYISKGFVKEVDSYKIELLYPFKVIKQEKTHNNHSQVFKIYNNNISVLFTGDMEKRVEKELIKKYNDFLKSDIIKIPHHGSNSSSSIHFIKLVNPEIGVISCSRNNYFRLPSLKIVKRYLKNNIRLLKTSQRGGILIYKKENELIIKTTK